MNALSAAPRSAPPATAGSEEKSCYTIAVVHDEVELKEHLAAWDNLARHAAEPNAFYESWALMPALKQFGAGEDLSFVLIYLPINAQRRQPLLCGFFPLKRHRLHTLVPAGVFELWRHLYCFLCTPLVRQGHATPVLEALFDWLKSDSRGASLLRLELVSGDGAFARALTEVCHRNRRPAHLVEGYCRALIEPRQDAVSYIGEALAYRHYKDYRRKERLLGERGKFERRILAPGEDVGVWTEQFLQLEARGWKGREGTAMVCRPADAAYFRDMVRGAFAAGRLMMLGLFLDGQPLAMKCNLLSGAGGFAFKIAFDESHAGMSPGMLLELANIEYLHQNRCAKWMDSCAEAEHPMINRLWLERRIIHNEYVATGRAPGDMLVSLMPVGRWLKRLVRPPARRAPTKE